jgi:hypothetical protein
MTSPYPYRVVITIQDSNDSVLGSTRYACFNTLDQAELAQSAANVAAYALEPADIEED